MQGFGVIEWKAAGRTQRAVAPAKLNERDRELQIDQSQDRTWGDTAPAKEAFNVETAVGLGRE